MNERDLLEEIRRCITDVKLDVARIRTVLLGFNGDPGIVGQLRDLESRVRKTEKWRWSIPPALLLAAASIGIAVTR